MVIEIPCGMKNSEKGARSYLEHTNYLVLNKKIWLSTVGVVFWKKKWGYFSQNQRTQPGALVSNELWNRKYFHLFSGRWCGGQSILYFKSPFIYNSELDKGGKLKSQVSRNDYIGLLRMACDVPSGADLSWNKVNEPTSPVLLSVLRKAAWDCCLPALFQEFCRGRGTISHRELLPQ